MILAQNLPKTANPRIVAALNERLQVAYTHAHACMWTPVPQTSQIPPLPFQGSASLFWLSLPINACTFFSHSLPEGNMGTQREKIGKRLRMQFSAFSYRFMAI